jgi:predicted Fe-S protein YdhL (DUF1289 family)
MEEISRWLEMVEEEKRAVVERVRGWAVRGP